MKPPTLAFKMMKYEIRARNYIKSDKDTLDSDVGLLVAKGDGVVNLLSLGSGEGDLDHGGAGNNIVVSDGVVDLGDDHVRSAIVDVRGDGDLVAVHDGGVKDLETRKEGSVLARSNTVTGDSDGLASTDIAGKGGRGEGHDGESSVGGGAALDKRGSKGVGLVEVQGLRWHKSKKK